MAEAQIILSHSRDSGIVAIASGEQYPWAHTALAQSGFRRGDGVYHLPADGNGTTVADLVTCAKRHRTSVHTSSRRFIGDAARDLARRLPGQWKTSVEIYSRPAWQEDLVPWIWDSGELGRALQYERLPYAATLTDPVQGTHLLLVERPGHQHDYLLGAFAPGPFDGGYGDPHAPRGIVLPPSPGPAAQTITDQYLPAYDRAVHTRKTAAVADTLDRIRTEHHTWTTMVASGPYGDTTPLGIDALGTASARLLDNAWGDFLTVMDHAPALLEQCRPATTRWPGDTDALAQLDAALSDAETVREELARGILLTRTERITRTWPAIETWLAHGERFLRQARAATPRQRSASAGSVTPPTLPPGRPAPRR
ncbi:hypothetical protein [Streptomyces sp. PSAA01]|uniref:hypothetical protein n=1 Tax=Streptomyces sp. PSAA01 TaxID=2912762 RepID=UPI001F436420|nr:hypothetical protein [Streptomyces sp. PSAA01]MCG0285418.1 hypothetical protein [Streptomyces sp. PSAA01]